MNSDSPTTDLQLRALVQQAERALAAGRSHEAGKLLDQAAAEAPGHPYVLNAQGLRELRNGNAAAARALFERAIERDAAQPAFWVNLASALRKLDHGEAEMRALERALALDPRHLPALLQKASRLELSGRTRAAAKVYLNALQSVPAAARLPEPLQRALKHAAECVRRNDAALEGFLADELRQLRETHPDAVRSRFEHCIHAFIGKQRIYMPQPTFLHFPSVPAWEFYPREDFPWLADLEAGAAEVRRELERVLAEDAGRLEPYIAYPEGVPIDQWAELNHSRRWSAYYLWKDGAPVTDHLARCPATAALLERVPRADVPGYAPTAFFSVLDAGARIPPHTGVTNTRLIVHLPLVVPPRCGFRVGSRTREWHVGEAWVFDDTIEHEAWNHSDAPRAILIFDIWNPFLTAAERDLVRAAVQGIRSFYRAEESLQ